MAASTAVVVPSLCDDPAPYAVMEASALRRPCIGSAHGGIPEIIGPGIVLHDDTPRTLAAAMHQLAVDRPAAIALGQRCYDFAFDRFRPQRVADALVAVYRRVAAH
jgi:glycosyltransferase involved in cell wall biosynthesis